jgi:hypothetical protein
MSMKYRVKVNTAKGGVMWWTMRGATLIESEATVFTDATMPPFFADSLNANYIEKVPVCSH